MRAFVLQFIGKRHLEHKSVENQIPIQICVLTAPRYDYTVPKWDRFVSIIHEALKDKNLSKNRLAFIVDTLIEEIKVPGRSYRASGYYIDVLRRLLESEKTEMDPIALIIHCESLLAALSTSDTINEVCCLTSL